MGLTFCSSARFSALRLIFLMSKTFRFVRMWLSASGIFRPSKEILFMLRSSCSTVKFLRFPSVESVIDVLASRIFLGFSNSTVSR